MGGALLRSLLGSAACTGVVALVRRAGTALESLAAGGRLTVVVIDFANLENEAAFHGAGCAAAFCTVGIGQPRKVSAEEFWRVDVEYAGAFARGVARAGARHVSLLSAIGANPDSRSRYIRTKGRAEQAVAAAGVPRTSLFRPSVLMTRTLRYGLQDRLTQTLFPLVAPLLPRRWHQIHVEELGRAMQANAEVPGKPGVEILYYPDYVALLAQRRAWAPAP